MLRYLLLFALFPAVVLADNITLLANGDISGWEYQTFDDIPETQYQQEHAPTLGHPILAADSKQGASGYTLQQEINLQETPWLHFLWRIDQISNNPAEKTKEGDDFVWRLYFVGRSGIRYRTLNYVYAQQAPTGETWESPYSSLLSDIRVHALASGEESNRWRISSINVAEQWQELFDGTPTIGLVGLMTDGDSANIDMRASYGLVVLSDSPTAPFAAE